MIVVNARFLTQNLTGVQRYALEVSQELKKLYGESVLFVCPKNVLHENYADKLEALRIGSLKGHLWEQIELPLFLKKTGAHPLLLNLGNTAPLFYNNSIVTIYDLAFHHHPEWFSKKFTSVYNFLVPRILKKAKHVITDSNYVKHDIAKTYGVNINNITTVYGGYSDFFYCQNSEKEGFALAVGSIDPRKNLKTLIDIFREMSDMNLVVIGKKHSLFSSQEFGEIPENVRFTGYVSDTELNDYYNRAMMFIYPSYFEGFGIPPLEAQVCGCPVLSSNTTSLPEVGDESFLYCDPYDAEDIKNKVLFMANNKDFRDGLIKKGFENIKRFSWEHSGANIKMILDEHNK